MESVHRQYIDKYVLESQSSFSLVDSGSQKLYFYQNGKFIKDYIISTALNGLGEEVMSFKTPRGLHQVKEKIGEGLKECSILKARKFTGDIWSASSRESGDLVLTRALWLDGLEDHNKTSLERYIYLHGTNAINSLGSACSEGCVRMSNVDIIELFDLVDTGHLVAIF